MQRDAGEKKLHLVGHAFRRNGCHDVGRNVLFLLGVQHTEWLEVAAVYRINGQGSGGVGKPAVLD